MNDGMPAAESSGMPDAEIVATLTRAGVLPAGGRAVIQPLTGGVSSDIFRIGCGEAAVVVKRALPRLRVAAEWTAPTERNRYEVRWMQAAARIVPGAVPRILGVFPGFFVMEHLDPAQYRNWKEELLAGHVDPGLAAEVGRILAAIHAATAHDPAMAREFATDHIFSRIRLEPYFGAAALRHPQIAAQLDDLSRQTLGRRIALVHGDVSPKNILAGPAGPVLLDAECAWYGDPAFDIAFCLNHLLLKCLRLPAARSHYLEAFAALWSAYEAGIAWELPEALALRAGRLLAAMMLARVDGKSPLEYLTQDWQRQTVRAFAVPRIAAAPQSPLALRQAWADELQRKGAT